MSGIENLEPKLVWKHFNEICKIPHCSKHEEKIRDYIVKFAKQQKLVVKTDKIGNVLVLKPASSGLKNKPSIILQGHMDMVCEKNSDVTHDFSKDPLHLKLNGDILMASGTTLGADNGIGVAVGLALLEATNVRHGPIEALFTVDEETGLTGAFNLEPNFLTGKSMINLDSEMFGVITVGCAGGGDSKIELPIKTRSAPSDVQSITVKLMGLKGGHSGVDIHEQRGNAIKLLIRILWKASQYHEFFISEIKGGDKHNAIPREAFVKIGIRAAEKSRFIAKIKAESQDIAEEIKPIDPDFKMSVDNCEQLKTVFDTTSQRNLLNLVHGLPHGVYKMSYDIAGLVETSTNLATITTNDDSVLISMSSRSAVKSELQDMRDRIRATASLCGAKVSEEAPYPGWKPNLESKLLARSKKVYKELHKQEPKVEAVHAGLECGIIGEKFPGMDMISVGPTIKHLHSPQEEVSVSSVEKFYQYIVKILENA